jgi:hypothetical protein
MVAVSVSIVIPKCVSISFRYLLNFGDRKRVHATNKYSWTPYATYSTIKLHSLLLLPCTIWVPAVDLLRAVAAPKDEPVRRVLRLRSISECSCVEAEDCEGIHS